jgi:hypothetical protein
MWPSLLKIQYTELKVSCGNDHVVKNYIYSNSDLDLWPNDPKINRAVPLPQGNHVVKFGKDPIYRTKVMWKRPCCLTTGSFPYDNFSSVYWIFNKPGHMIPLLKGNNHIYFGVIRSKVKVTVTINRSCY